MTDTNKKSKDPENKISFLDYIFEIIGWLQIVVSPLIPDLMIGAVIHF